MLRGCAGEALGAMLNFLLQLGFREVGAPFAAASLRAPERGIAADLAQLGLLLPFRCTPHSSLRASAFCHHPC